MADQPDMQSLGKRISSEIGAVVSGVPDTSLIAAARAVLAAPRIFVFGEGRSGLALRMGAMRLVHLGKLVHIVGDATTPAILGGDLLIVASGSGETAVTALITEQAGATGAEVLAFTANAESRIAKAADQVILLRTPAKGGHGEGTSIQAGGSLFEQSLLVTLDTLFLVLAGDDAAATIERHHANLE